MIPDHSVTVVNIAVFGLREEGDCHKLAFLRGTGGGKLLKSIPAIIEDTEMLEDFLDLETRNDVFRYFAEMLAEELEDPDHERVMKEAAAYGVKEPELMVFLVDHDAAHRLISSMTDFQIKALPDASLELWMNNILVSDEEDQICTTRNGGATLMALFVGPKRQARIVGIERAWIGDDDPNSLDDPFEVTGQSGDTGFAIQAYHLNHEWSGKVSQKNAASSFMERLTALRHIQEATQSMSKEVHRQRDEITKGIQNDIYNWAFSELSPTLAEPFAQKNGGEIYQAATEAPIAFGGLCEPIIEDLLKRVAIFDDALGSDHPREEMDNQEKHRFGCFGWGSGFGKIYNEGEIVFELSSRTEDLPATISHAMPLSKASRRILGEIVKAADPTGDAIRGHANNRASSAIPGPARRLYNLGTPKPHSAHEELEAIDGLSEFLKERGHSDDEISRILSS